MTRKLTPFALASLLALCAATVSATPRSQTRTTRSPSQSARYRAFALQIRARFAVNPAKAPRSVGLFTALDTMRTQHRPQFEQALGMLGKYAMAALTARGLPLVTVQKRVAKMQKSARAGEYETLVYRALVHTPDRMKTLLQALHDPSMPFAQRVPNPTQSYALDQRVDLSQGARLLTRVPAPKTSIEAAYGPLVQASVRNPRVSDRQAKQNSLAAEVFDRLAANQHVTGASGRFSVTFNGRAYTHLGDFLGALRQSGHRVRVRFDHHNADFMGLKLVGGATKAEQQQNLEAGRYKHVAAALHTTVPIKTAGGAAAIRPVAHSEIVVEVDASRVRRGDRFSGKVKGYQGVPSTGFFPLANSENSDWSGNVTAGRIRDSKRAVKAVVGFGLYTAAINHTSKKQGRRMGDYGGAPGVCNDSVAVCQLSAKLPVTGYPMMGAETAGYLEAALGKLARTAGRPGDRAHYRSLLRSVKILGRDDAGDSPTARPARNYLSPLERAHRSLPRERAMGSETELGALLAPVARRAAPRFDAPRR
jgi:hypothetical protein